MPPEKFNAVTAVSMRAMANHCHPPTVSVPCGQASVISASTTIFNPSHVAILLGSTCSCAWNMDSCVTEKIASQ